MTDCVICLDKLQAPRTLPCSHSFCELCLSEYIISTVSIEEANSYNCPVCRSLVEISDPSIDKSKWAILLPQSETPVTKEEVKQHCHPCKRVDNQTIDAVCWCSNCSEALCQSCSVIHRRFATTSMHKTVTLENVLKKDLEHLFLVSEFCQTHTKSIIAYCSNHKHYCCVLCLANDHRKCENIQTWDEASAADTKEGGFEQFEKDMEDLQKLVKKMSVSIYGNKQALQSAIKEVTEKARSYASKMKFKIDDDCQVFCKEALNLQDGIETDLDKLSKQLGNISSSIANHSKQLRTAVTYGSKTRSVMSLDQAKSKFKDAAKEFQDIVKNEKKVDIFWAKETLDKFINSTELFGSISMARDDRYLKVDDVPENLKAHFKYGFESLNLEFIKTFDLKDKKIIHGASVSSTAFILLCRKEIVLGSCDESNQIIRSKTLININPKELCFNEGSKTLFVSGSSSKGVSMSFDGNNSFSGEVVHTFNKMICGVACIGTGFYVLTDAAILQFDLNVSKVFIDTDTSGIDDTLTVDHETRRLAFTVRRKSGLCFASLDDKEKSLYTGSLKEFVSIAFGPNGVLFVVDGEGNVHVVDVDERRTRVVLRKLQKIPKVRGIWVDIPSSNLFLYDSDYVEMYKIKMR